MPWNTITPRQAEELCRTLWPDYWKGAAISDICIVRRGVMETIEGGLFEFRKWNIKAKDAVRIREEWEKMKSSTGELFRGVA